jgi:serine/threonine protein kinase
MKNIIVKLKTKKYLFDSIYANSNFKTHYKVLDLLGNGSNSNVYLARERNSRKLFAVKKLSKSKISDQSNDLRNFKVFKKSKKIIVRTKSNVSKKSKNLIAQLN